MELVNYDVMDPKITLAGHQMLKLDKISNGCRGCDGAKIFTSGGSDGCERVNRMGEDEIQIVVLGEGVLLVCLLQ